jgi:hypothetical protein
MAGFDYPRVRSTADRLVGRFGQPVTIKRPGAATGPAHNPTIAAPVSYSATAVVTVFSKREVDGERVRVTDKRVMVGAGDLNITPETSDTITIGGVEHAIISVTPTSPGGVAVIYEIQARK